VVSLALATRIVAMLPERQRAAILKRSLEWLVTRHPGLTVYLGVHGRPYSQDERATIAKECAAVEGLACPFLDGELCKLDRLPGYEPELEVGRAPYLWIPTAMAKLLGEHTLREAVRLKEVADAKVTMLSRNEALY